MTLMGDEAGSSTGMGEAPIANSGGATVVDGKDDSSTDVGEVPMVSSGTVVLLRNTVGTEVSDAVS